MRKLIAAAAGALLVAGCSTGGAPTMGSAQGTVSGSPFGVGPGPEGAMGAISGGLLGVEVGQSLGERDRELALQAEYEALEFGRAGRPVTWRNPDSGMYGEIVVGGAYEVNRLDCRQYTHTAFIGGRARVVRGTACRQPDGQWRIVS